MEGRKNIFASTITLTLDLGGSLLVRLNNLIKKTPIIYYYGFDRFINI